MAGDLGITPISPVDYQADMGIGFSTDFFRRSSLIDNETNAELSKMVDDIQAAGFNNLRLRCDGGVNGFLDVGSEAAPAIDQVAMDRFLTELDRLLDIALPKGLAVTIAWQHNNAEGRISAQDGDNFVQWWQQVAEHTQGRSYLLSYNLMLELGQQSFGNLPHNGLYDFPEIYNDWTTRALNTIRSMNGPGSNNVDRNVIVTAPQNTKVESLDTINASTLADNHLLVEYHSYAAGPKSTGRNAWTGDGTPEDRARLTDRLDGLADFTARTGVPIYWGAWMPMDNNTSTLNQAEVNAFGEFFAYELAQVGMPWSLNKLENYYDIDTNTWLVNELFPNNTTINVQQALSTTLAGYLAGSNQAPTAITLSDSIAENQPSGSLVGTLDTTDPNVGDTFTYTLVTGAGDADNASFNLVGGTLRSSAVFDFESKSAYAIRVRTEDQYGASFEQALMVSIIDVPLAYDLPTQTSVRNQLLSGVSRIADMGSEGTVAVFGENATSILEDSNRETVVAAVDNGTSRIVVAAKTGFTDLSNSTQFDTGTFYHNTLNWLSRGLGNSARIVTDNSGTRAWLLSQGYNNVTQRSDWENGLSQADILVTKFGTPTAAQQAAAANFLASGKSLFAGYNGWAFTYSGVTALTASSNSFLRNYGVAWTENVASFTGVITEGTELGNALLTASVVANPGNYTLAQRAESVEALAAASASVPATDLGMSAIRQSILAGAPTATPTPNSPVTDSLVRFQLDVESSVLSTLLPNELFAHRTASSYGAIPATAARVTKSIAINVSAANADKQWLSTGLYAVPGEPLTVTVPTLLVNQGWTIKIGSHDDDLSNLTTYKRMPTGTSRDEAISSASFQVGSVYGGMVYLTKPSTTHDASHNVTISGAIEAPTFILGATTDADWNTSIRNQPAPYAELISNGIIITLHSEDIRSLANPTAVMTYWQSVVDAEDHVTNSPVPRTRPERIDDDLQISNGWMHSGYPIAAYDHNLANMVDSDPSDDWGFFHEIGHNHQSPYWTFSGEGEITVNIMSMRAFDSLGLQPADNWNDMWTATGRASRIPGFIANGRVRTDPGQSLVTYAQLREGFGWNAFEQFFRDYQTDAPANLPTTEQQERDQWVTRFSKIVGKNLGPFFTAWGFAPSTAALNSVSSLPAWSMLEAVQPNLTLTSTINASTTFNPRAGFVDVMSDPLTVSFATSPTHGTLTSNADGSFTFAPNANWSGEEVLEYSISNAHGGISGGSVKFVVVNRVTSSTAIDTEIRKASPNTNRATATTFSVDSSTINGVHNASPAQGLLRFDNLFGTGVGQIPANAVITDARLTLEATDPGDAIEFHRMLQPWVDTTTWNLMVNGIQTNGVEAVTTADVTTASVSVGKISIDVSNSLTAWLANPSSNFGWALIPTGANGVDLVASNSSVVANRPTLSVDYYLANAAPTDIALSQNTIAENAVTNSLIGKLSAPGSDAGNTITYAFAIGSGSMDNGSFSIDSFGNLRSNAIFNYEVKSNYSIRVRATDAAGAWIEKTLSISVSNELELSSGMSVNEGVAQRSNVTSLSVSFDQAIEYDAGAFQVYQRRNVQGVLQLVPVTTNVTLTPKGAGVTATLNFSGSLTRDNGSLVDGNYQLIVNGDLVRVAGTTKSFDADGNGTAGGQATFGNAASDNFYAMFGDANGDRVVSITDFLNFRSAYGKSVGKAGYDRAFDYNGDGSVDALDYSCFRLNYTKSCTFF